MVPYDHLISLMHHAEAIINPSLFEGWSSSVEEAKALDKTILVSDLAVHREQKPEKGIYFDPHDAQDLADRMQDVMTQDSAARDPIPTQLLAPSYGQARRQFADTYCRLVGELAGGRA